MDEFERLSYTQDHIQHFQNRLEPAYQGVSLSVALATPEAKECLQEIVDAALLRDLEIGGRNSTDDVSRRIITTTELRDRWLYPKDEADVLDFYDDPSKIAATWAVQPSERATPSGRVSCVLSHIQGERQGIGASHSLVASTRLKAGSVVFLYRGAALSSACVAEYEDHQPSVEIDFAAAYCWSETVPGRDALEEIALSCKVSNEIEGTWAGYANDGRSLEGALGSYMTSQVARVERIMHEGGTRVPWLEQDTQASPVGERPTNINIEPAIFFKTTSRDGQTKVSGAEFFVIGRATADIEVGQEALLDYGKEYWDKQGTVVAGMLDVALLQRRCEDAQHQARALAQASLNSVTALLNVAKMEMITTGVPSGNGATVGRLLADSEAALDACIKATQQGLLADSTVSRELEQCSRALADLKADRANACKPPAPSQHLDERQSANSCITAEDQQAAATGGPPAGAPSHTPEPAPLAASSTPARSGLSKRLRKGWTGGPVGLTCKTHDSLPVTRETADQRKPAGADVGVDPSEAGAKRLLSVAAQAAEKCARTDAAMSCVSPAPVAVSGAQGCVLPCAAPRRGTSTRTGAAPRCTCAPGTSAQSPSVLPSCSPAGSSAAAVAGSPLKRAAPDTSTDQQVATARARQHVAPRASPDVSPKPSIRADNEQAVAAVCRQGDSDRDHVSGEMSEVGADLPSAEQTVVNESTAAAAPDPVAGPCTGASVGCAAQRQRPPAPRPSALLPSVQPSCNALGASAAAVAGAVVGSQRGSPQRGSLVQHRESAALPEQSQEPEPAQEQMVEAPALPQVSPQPPTAAGSAQAVGEQGDSGREHAGWAAPRCQVRMDVPHAKQSVAMEPPAAAPATVVGLSVAHCVKQGDAAEERSVKLGGIAAAVVDPAADSQQGSPPMHPEVDAETEQPAAPGSAPYRVVQPPASLEVTPQAPMKPASARVDVAGGDERDSDQQHAGRETPEVGADVPSAQQSAAAPAVETGPSPAPRVKQEVASEEGHIGARNSAATAAGSVADLQRASVVKPAIKPENDQTAAAVGCERASDRQRAGRETPEVRPEVRADVPSARQSAVMGPMAAAPEAMAGPSVGPHTEQAGGCAGPGRPFAHGASAPLVPSLNAVFDRAAAAVDAVADLQRGSPPQPPETGAPAGTLEAPDSEKKRVRLPQTLPGTSLKPPIRPTNEQAGSTVVEQRGSIRERPGGEMAEGRPDVPAAERSAAADAPAAPETEAGPATGGRVKQEGVAEQKRNKGLHRHRAGTAQLSIHADTRGQAGSLEDADRAAHCRSIAQGDGTRQAPKHRSAATPLQTANAVPGENSADANAAAVGNGTQQPVPASSAGPSTLGAAVLECVPIQDAADAPTPHAVIPGLQAGAPPPSAGPTSGADASATEVIDLLELDSDDGSGNECIVVD